MDGALAKYKVAAIKKLTVWGRRNAENPRNPPTPPRLLVDDG